MSKLKIGVAGAGVFGNNHAKKVRGNPRAELVGIFDIHLERACALATEHGVQGYDDLNLLLANCDALVVATPASAHGGVARAALNAGKHCLVEKPLAATIECAAILCDIAEEKKLILQAGHQERYIFKAMGLFDVKEVPNYIEATRIGLPSLRGADVSATLDLMVHDIDLAYLLFRSEPKVITSKLLAGDKTKPDAIEAEIEYENGSRAKFIASRAAEERERKTLIQYQRGKVEIDYISREFEDSTGFGFHKDFAQRIADPMQQAMDDFVASILDNAPVFVPGRDGEKAVIIAQHIDEAVQ